MVTTLYHYCSGQVLASILSTGQIWMTDPRFLNDAEEIRHGLRVLESSIYESANAVRASYLANGCTPENFDAFVRQQVKVGVSLTDPSRSQLNLMPSGPAEFTLVFCLSEERDDLSQWRAYGNGEYAIGFDSGKLAEAAHAQLLSITYVGLAADPNLVATITDWFNAKVSYVNARSGNVIDAEVWHEGITDVLSRLWRDNYFIRLKHEAFKKENELRLIRKFQPRQDAVELRPAGRYPSPMAKVSIFDPRAIGRSDRAAVDACPIVEIVSGPGADPQLAGDFKHAVSKLGFRIRWDASKAPYRKG